MAMVIPQDSGYTRIASVNYLKPAPITWPVSIGRRPIWLASPFPCAGARPPFACGCVWKRVLRADRGGLGVDRPLLDALGDRHLAGLSCLGHRDAQRQYAGLVAGLEALRVERVAQEQLAGERAVRALGGDHLIALSALKAPLCLDRQHVLLDGEVDRARVHARQVKRNYDSSSRQ